MLCMFNYNTLDLNPQCLDMFFSTNFSKQLCEFYHNTTKINIQILFLKHTHSNYLSNSSIVYFWVKWQCSDMVCRSPTFCLILYISLFKGSPQFGSLFLLKNNGSSNLIQPHKIHDMKEFFQLKILQHQVKHIAN